MEDHLMPFLSQDDVEYARDQMEKSINAIATETGSKYKGILYGQFMKTAKGLKLIEYNIRFGDPEAMNILPIIKTNFVDVCQQILDGNLNSNIEFENKATVCKYLVPTGYPDTPIEHSPIIVDEVNLKKLGIKVYYASVSEEKGKIFTSSSRAIGILGIADSVKQAEKLAEKGTTYVKGQLFHRTDIGTQGLIERRVKHMENLLKSIE
jgi:phosphoribosylamine--glycine ligase